MEKVVYSIEPISKIIICGGRHFDNYDYLEMVVDNVIAKYEFDLREIEIVSGHCEGADQLGEQYSKSHNIDCAIFPAEWKKYGKAAGPIRNSEMVNYASDCEFPIVIAFVNSKTKGTMDTINKSKKYGFDTFIFEYDIEDTDVGIFSGVSLDDSGNYNFDFNKDEPNDIIKLSKQHINTTRLSGNIRYYGYKIQQNIEDTMKLDFLSWIKTPEGYLNAGTKEMIDRCVEEFVTNNNEVYDAIISTSSSSHLTDILSHKISEAFGDIPIIQTSKLNVSYLEVDEDKIALDCRGKSSEYIEKLVTYIRKRYIYPQIKAGYFSMRKISPRYRKWIRPMFKFEDENIDVTQFKNVLIVDETLTSSASVSQIISLLHSTGYKNQIQIFTLISNR